MSVESANRVYDPEKIRARKLSLLVNQKLNNAKGEKVKAARYFTKKENGLWVEKGCDKCGRGMSKEVYDFQRANRPEGTVCSTCSKKEDQKSLERESVVAMRKPKMHRGYRRRIGPAPYKKREIKRYVSSYGVEIVDF